MSVRVGKQPLLELIEDISQKADKVTSRKRGNNWRGRPEFKYWTESLLTLIHAIVVRQKSSIEELLGIEKDNEGNGVAERMQRWMLYRIEKDRIEGERKENNVQNSDGTDKEKPKKTKRLKRIKAPEISTIERKFDPYLGKNEPFGAGIFLEIPPGQQALQPSPDHS
jgi:hypothetical protein